MNGRRHGGYATYYICNAPELYSPLSLIFAFTVSSGYICFIVWARDVKADRHFECAIWTLSEPSQQLTGSGFIAVITARRFYWFVFWVKHFFYSYRLFAYICRCNIEAFCLLCDYHGIEVRRPGRFLYCAVAIHPICMVLSLCVPLLPPTARSAPMRYVIDPYRNVLGPIVQ
jgi:hypothetical protein